MDYDSRLRWLFNPKVESPYMIRRLPSIIALVALTLGSIGICAAQSEQRDLIKPITKKLTIIYIPKVIHPWYDVVHDGANFAVDELKKQGIDVDVVWWGRSAAGQYRRPKQED